LLPTDDEEGSDYINANYVPVYWFLQKKIVFVFLA
jgi:protein tyrosine phosphatase